MSSSEARYHNLLQQTPIALWAVDSQGVFTLAEGKALADMGLVRQEALGRSIFDVYADEPAMLEAVRRAMAGETFSETIQFAFGTCWETHFSPARDDDGSAGGASGVSTEVTERVRTERQTRESEERYRTLVDFANDPILVECDGRIGYANHAAAALLGTASSRALLGRGLLDFLPPEDHRWMVDVISRIRSGELVGTPIRTRVYREDGTLRSVELSCAPVRYRGNDALHLNLRDTSARAQAELGLRQTLRAGALAHMSGRIAHGLNNLLTAIRGNADLLRDEVPQDAHLADCLNEIEDATQQGVEFAHRMLAFSRRQAPRARTIDLGATALEAEQALRCVLPAGVQLRLELDATPVQIRADPAIIRHILLELAFNALDAMPKEGRLLISVRRARQDDVARSSDGKAGPRAVVEVTDTGNGVAGHDQARAFEHFFTTKENRQALGLGLPTVREQVQHDGGEIELDSEPGEGTTVRILLPSVEPSMTDEDTGVAGGELAGSETILVVEDNAGVRSLAVNILRRFGYRVMEASRPSDALLLCVSGSSKIDLLLVDMVMPMMSGRELAQRAIELFPDIAVVYTSGLADGSELPVGQVFLAKPFSSADLVRVVRQALSERRAATTGSARSGS
ncbi:MAG: PAS domain S-box protein [Planctomycetota bacterium]